MQHNFYQNRDFLRNEYLNAKFDPATGKSPDEILQMTRTFLRENAAMPLPLQTAHCWKILLENVQLEINPRSIFPDKINNGASYAPFQSLSVLGKLILSRNEELFCRLLPEIKRQNDASNSIGLASPGMDFWHSVPDWERVIHLGIYGLYQNAVAQKHTVLQADETDTERAVFFDAVILSYQSVLEYMRRLADYARGQGVVEFADTVEALTHRAPETLYEAMFTSIFYLNIGELGIEHLRTYGRIDQLFYPYYQKDIAEGRITPEDADEMLRYFFQKTDAAQREADQPICLGGCDENGEDASNALTVRMLNVYRELKLHNPKIHLRCCDKTPRSILRMALDMIRGGSSSIVLMNDATAIKAYHRIGIDEKTARAYLPIGCYEPVISGKEDARICGSWINLLAPVPLCVHARETDATRLLRLPVPSAEPQTFADFLQGYFDILGASIEFVIGNLNRQYAEQYHINPAPFLSGSYKSCMERGLDIFHQGAEIRNTSVKCFAIGSTVDALLAVKKAVYDEKLLTLREFSDVLRKNWEGNEKLRRLIQRDRNKWGNDLPEPNVLGKRIYQFCADKIIGRKNAVGGVFRLGADSVAMSEQYGKHVPATPDGRYDFSPTTKNFRAENGMERKGITAFILSITELDGSWFLDGAPLDFLVHPSAVQGEKGLDTMENMIQTYFKRGGFSIQGNVLNANMLRDAQANPEQYQDLQVRVCGWNEYFVNMSKFLQNDLIARADGVENA